MSSGSESEKPGPEGLQFDRAEFDEAAPSAVACAACKRPIVDQYYEIVGNVLCGPCRERIEGQLRGGSAIARFSRAVLFGKAAAVAGAAAYAASILATEHDFALVSILVGFLVGKGVRAGSRNRGGLPYQVLAVSLTYLALGLAYATVHYRILDVMSSPELPRGLPALVEFFVTWTLRSPVDEVRDSVISIAIIGFALWQAWKMNPRRELAVGGPFQVAGAGPAGPVEGASAHA